MRWSRCGTQRVVLSEEARECQQIRDIAVVLQQTSLAEASAGVALIRGGAQRVARLYGFAPPSDLVKPTRRPSEARQVALYGLRWWAGEGLSAIARRMGVSDSAVSRRGTVVAQRLREDAQFRSRVERVTHVTLKT